MTKIEIDSGRSSSATHRMTQSSTTLNRRYVKRPANIAVEEAARTANLRRAAAKPESASAAPSRLVNLGVRAADLAAAKEHEAAAKKAAEEARMAEIARASEAAAMQSFQNFQPISTVPMYPRVVEYGSLDPVDYNPIQSNEQLAAQNNMQPADPSAMQAYPTDLAAQPQDTSAMAAMSSQPMTMESAPASEIDTSDLALSIAADYAAASLGASMQEFGNNYDNYAYNQPEVPPTENHATPSAFPDLATIDPRSADSVDAIAQAASAAIASIRTATEPSEVSEQVASLKTFAESIKSDASMPEMKELGTTIEKFVNIAMKSTKIQEETKKKANAPTVATVSFSPKVTRAANKVAKSSAKMVAASSRNRSTAKPGVNLTSANRTNRIGYNRNTLNTQRRLSPNELKERAIEEALHSVATMSEPSAKRRPAMKTKRKGGAKRFAIAFACAALCVGGVLAFVGSNIPDISLRVAAMQTGITAAYPSYIPRDYTLGDIYSEDGKITMIFNGPHGATFNLIEEKSSWDSSALVRNYIEPVWGDAYTTTHEQGITIYIADQTSDAAWVNSGILYKITSAGTPLTKKQVRSIVVSL